MDSFLFEELKCPVGLYIIIKLTRKREVWMRSYNRKFFKRKDKESRMSQNGNAKNLSLLFITRYISENILLSQKHVMNVISVGTDV